MYFVFDSFHCTNDYIKKSNPQLQLTASPALQPPEVEVDPNVLKQYQQELDAAAKQPLPEDDDDL